MLVLGVRKCGIHRQQSVAHVRLHSLHGRINVSNEPFCRFGTPAYCTIYASFWFYITLTGRVQTVANAGIGIAMAVDITITIYLCTLLAMTRTGFRPECVPFGPLCAVLGLFNVVVT